MKSLWSVLLALVHGGVALAAAPLAEFDFTHPPTAALWTAAHDIPSLRSTVEGLEITIAGEDPYFIGPARNYPADQPLWLTLRLKSDQGGHGQVFYFPGGTSPTEAASVHFEASPGQWSEVLVPMPALGPNHRLRLDPPGQSGKCLLSWLRLERRILYPPPTWPKPEPPATAGARRIRSGELEIAVAHHGGFRFAVGGADLGQSYDPARIGYLAGDDPRWFDLADPEWTADPANPLGLTLVARQRDPDGADWTLTRRITPGRQSGTLDLETSLRVNQERKVLYLPMLILLPGAQSFGTNKSQGLFPGLEYLDNEPSSTEADLRGPGAQRQTPAQHKITFPLLAIAAQDRYVGLVWEQAPHFSALFDSPDRLFQSGGHALGVIFPGSDGRNRVEGSLLPYFAETLAPNRPLVLRAQLIGGRGRSAVAAVQHYVRLRGWPAVPQTGYNLSQYANLTAHGWLDSQIREGTRFRHAVAGDSFKPSAAADPAMYMDWLADRTPQTALADRLHELRDAVVRSIPPEQLNSTAVGHVRHQAPALVYGHVLENAELARTHARQQLTRFGADGSIPFRKSPQGLDYGSTHFAPDANGLTAQVAEVLLENAAFSGDRALVAQAVARLRALDKFHDSVPRGAQTWEIPLHTPDILASAHLVQAYTLGYELTGDKSFLDQAVYWAWTGVPFVYLTPPTPRGIGPYSTIAVYGATAWVAPVWCGLPVQWCGMVYADALYRLARHDPATPWKQVADGITAAGIQITWPLEDQAHQGLLPDGFELVSQRRNGPAINPGTVQAGAVRLYGGVPLDDFHAFRQHGWLAFAPGEIARTEETAAAVRFEARVWPQHPCWVFVNGFTNPPDVKLDGQPVSLTAPHQFEANSGRLVLQLTGPTTVEITR